MIASPLLASDMLIRIPVQPREEVVDAYPVSCASSELRSGVEAPECPRGTMSNTHLSVRLGSAMLLSAPFAVTLYATSKE